MRKYGNCRRFNGGSYKFLFCIPTPLLRITRRIQDQIMFLYKYLYIGLLESDGTFEMGRDD